jgi:hypothetical protein
MGKAFVFTMTALSSEEVVLEMGEDGSFEIPKVIHPIPTIDPDQQNTKRSINCQPYQSEWVFKSLGDGEFKIFQITETELTVLVNLKLNSSVFPLHLVRASRDLILLTTKGPGATDPSSTKGYLKIPLIKPIDPRTLESKVFENFLVIKCFLENH